MRRSAKVTLAIQCRFLPQHGIDKAYGTPGCGCIQMRNFLLLVAHAHVTSPNKLLGDTVAVRQATEMHVFLLKTFDVLSLTYREVRPRYPQLEAVA